METHFKSASTTLDGFAESSAGQFSKETTTTRGRRQTRIMSRPVRHYSSYLNLSHTHKRPAGSPRPRRRPEPKAVGRWARDVASSSTSRPFERCLVSVTGAGCRPINRNPHPELARNCHYQPRRRPTNPSELQWSLAARWPVAQTSTSTVLNCGISFQRARNKFWADAPPRLRLHSRPFPLTPGSNRTLLLLLLLPLAHACNNRRRPQTATQLNQQFCPR